MYKKVFINCIYFIIGLFLGITLKGIVTPIYANSNFGVKNITEVNSVNYETVYVNGTKYIVFRNYSGSDIEVMKAY